MAAPTWTPCRVSLGSLKPWAANPRLSTKAQAKRILASFAKFGQVLAIAIGPDGEVYDGHQRLSALLTIHGADHEIDARRASRALTDDERRALVITLHAGAIGAWNWDDLAGWDAAALGEWGMDAQALKQWNTDAAALAAMLEAEKPAPVDAEPQIDRAEELRAKWGVEPGQLWRLGEHRLICGDCTDAGTVGRVMGGEMVDCLMVDPPYGMNLDTDFSKMPETRIASRSYAAVEGDNKDFDAAPFIEQFGSVREQFWWGADYYYQSLPPHGSWLVWDKRNENSDGLIGNHFETCWSKTPHRRKMVRHHWSGVNARNPGMERMHPTEKPISVLVDVLGEHTKAGAVVVDLFSGSGTTIIACERLGRRCRAVEISPAYVAVALERWATATGGTPELVE